MKIIFEKPMLERLHDARHNSLRDQKPIEKVILTVAEMRALLREIGSAAWTCGLHSDLQMWLDELEAKGRTHMPQPVCTVLGLKIEIVK